MRFFGISQHISGMADIRQILACIDPAHTLDDLTLSAHHWVMGRPRDRVPRLEGDGWRRVVGDDEEAARFHAEWRERLDPYDAFICFHPPVFARLYRLFDKPIVCQFSIRYEYPYHQDARRWTEFNDDLRQGTAAGRILLCANNPYDARYGEVFLGCPVPFVPSLCEYTGVKWRPERGDVVYYCSRRIAELEVEGHLFAHKPAALPRGHTWADVARCRAIAHFPYNVSTISIVEQYAMGVPLLFPTLDYAVSLYERGAPVFGQISWPAVPGAPPGSAVTPPGGFPDGHDPNDFSDVASLRWWLRYADYYDPMSMRGLTYFASLEELRALARESDAFYRDAGARMRAFHETRRSLALEGWRRMIAAIG